MFNYKFQCDGLTWGGGKTVQDLETPFESRMASAAASRDPSRAPSPAPLNPQETPTENGCESSSGCTNPSSAKVHFEQNNKRDSSGSDVSAQLRNHRRNLKKVRGLASAILQVAQVRTICFPFKKSSALFLIHVGDTCAQIRHKLLSYQAT